MDYGGQVPQIGLGNVQAVAPKSKSVGAVVKLVTHQGERSWLNDDALLNIEFISVTLETSHMDMSWLNEDAPENKAAIFVTFEVSQLERSWLKDDAL